MNFTSLLFLYSCILFFNTLITMYSCLFWCTLYFIFMQGSKCISCVCFCRFPRIYMREGVRNRKLTWYGLKCIKVKTLAYRKPVTYFYLYALWSPCILLILIFLCAYVPRGELMYLPGVFYKGWLSCRIYIYQLSQATTRPFTPNSMMHIGIQYSGPTFYL